MEQLSIFDELDRRDVAARAGDDSLEGHLARYGRGELLAGESCPGCGHVFECGGYDGSRNHIYGDSVDLICSGMEVARRHLAIALSNDPQCHKLANGDEASARSPPDGPRPLCTTGRPIPASCCTSCTRSVGPAAFLPSRPRRARTNQTY